MNVLRRYAPIHARSNPLRMLRASNNGVRFLANSTDGSGSSQSGRGSQRQRQGQGQRQRQGQGQGRQRQGGQGQRQVQGHRQDRLASGEREQGKKGRQDGKQGRPARRRRRSGMDGKEFVEMFGMTPVSLKEEVYNLQLKEPTKWTDQALSAKYNLPVSKVQAMLQMRKHEIQYQKERPDVDDTLDVLARQVFGEFTLAGKKRMFDEATRQSQLADSDNFLVLHPSEPSLEKQRKKWAEKGQLNRTKIGFKQEDHTGTAFLVDSEEASDPYPEDDDKVINKTKDGFVFLKA